MSKQDGAVPAYINSRTGAISLMHEGNSHLTKRGDMVETMVIQENNEGPFIEVDSGKSVIAAASSNDLARIGKILLSHKSQRQTLLASALRLSGAEQYLSDIGVYDADTDGQALADEPDTPDTPESEGEGVTDVTDQLLREQEKKRGSAKPSRSQKKQAQAQKGSNADFDI